jgi:hypothetical protein
MKKREDSMMHSVNDDSHDDLVDELDDLILGIFDDLEDFEIENE